LEPGFAGAGDPPVVWSEAVDSLVGALGIYAATLVAGVASGLIPVINGELYLIGVVLLAPSTLAAVALALLLSVGTMVAKIILYQTARGATQLGHGRVARGLERARSRMERWREKPLIVTFVSSITGLPPFYLVTLAAGMLEIPLWTFVGLGFVGRVIRFVTIALIVVHA
jgi:membrane protein YqaA with SNARE-associated domain